MNPDGTQDVNSVSLYETSNGQSLTFATIDGTGGTAALKITSKATNLKVAVETLIGGSENGIDLNNEASNISVIFNELQIHGKYGISAKTCKNVTFEGHLSGTPSQWHVNLGSWSDQSKAVQTKANLALTADRYPIVVWVGNSDMPTLDNAKKYKVIGFGSKGPLVRKLVMILWTIGKKLKLA